MIILTLEYIRDKLEKYDNKLVNVILCCCQCFFVILERFLKFVSKNAYIMCAIHGKPFCESAAHAFKLLSSNIVRTAALSGLTTFVFFLGKLSMTIGMGGIAYFYVINYVQNENHYNENIKYTFIPIIMVGIGTYCIMSIFFKVYSMAISTIFLCFCKFGFYCIYVQHLYVYSIN